MLKAEELAVSKVKRMRVHSLNCGTMRAVGFATPIVCHVLLVECADQLMLIDTGFGNEDIRDPKGRIGAPRFLLRPALSVRETAIAQVAELGLDPKDVRTILLTHADVDHIGGLTDFPWAEVYLHAQELQSFASPRVWSDKNRYRPAGWLKERGVHAVTLSSQTAWQGLDASKDDTLDAARGRDGYARA